MLIVMKWKSTFQLFCEVKVKLSINFVQVLNIKNLKRTQSRQRLVSFSIFDWIKLLSEPPPKGQYRLTALGVDIDPRLGDVAR